MNIQPAVMPATVRVATPASKSEAGNHKPGEAIKHEIGKIGNGVKQEAAKGFVLTLDIRVPTTTRAMTDERREKILQAVQPGDIILETDNAYPGWQRLEFFTMRSAHTHAAMYEGDGKFIEATTPDGVQRTDLKQYLHGNMMVTIVRPDYKTTQDRDAALDFCRSQLGKPYNTAFDMSDPKSQYCAELVYDALRAMPNKQEAPLTQVFGKPAVAPDAFLSLPNATKVYSDGANFWKNQLSHWPVALFSVGSAALAGMYGGSIGGVGGMAAGLGLGLVSGLGLAICAGNKYQTGHFNLSGM